MVKTGSIQYLTEPYGLALDVHIINTILHAEIDKKVVTTDTIARTFNWLDKEKFFLKANEERYYQKKIMVVSYRLKKMAEQGFIKIEKSKKSNKKVFVLIGEKIIRKHKFPDGYKNSLQVKGKNRKWIVLEI